MNILEKEKKKAEPEKDTRNRIFWLASQQGCLREVQETLTKYEKLLHKCSNGQERDQIATMGITEIYRMLNIQGGLTVDLKPIIPPSKNIDEIIEKQRD